MESFSGPTYEPPKAGRRQGRYFSRRRGIGLHKLRPVVGGGLGVGSKIAGPTPVQRERGRTPLEMDRRALLLWGSSAAGLGFVLALMASSWGGPLSVVYGMVFAIGGLVCFRLGAFVASWMRWTLVSGLRLFAMGQGFAWAFLGIAGLLSDRILLLVFPWVCFMMGSAESYLVCSIEKPGLASFMQRFWRGTLFGSCLIGGFINAIDFGFSQRVLLMFVVILGLQMGAWITPKQPFGLSSEGSGPQRLLEAFRKRERREFYQMLGDSWKQKTILAFEQGVGTRLGTPWHSFIQFIYTVALFLVLSALALSVSMFLV